MSIYEFGTLHLYVIYDLVTLILKICIECLFFEFSLNHMQFFLEKIIFKGMFQAFLMLLRHGEEACAGSYVACSSSMVGASVSSATAGFVDQSPHQHIAR